jgi:hypothetical protein
LGRSAQGNEEELLLNFKYAFDKEWRDGFVVIRAKNLNTGKTTEICTQPGYVIDAIRQQYGIGEFGPNRTIDSLINKNEMRYFEFNREEALRVLALDTYTSDELDSLEKTVNFDTIISEIKRDSEWTKSLGRKDEGKLIRMWAHILFNKGILTGESVCRGGTGTLFIINRASPRW